MKKSIAFIICLLLVVALCLGIASCGPKFGDKTVRIARWASEWEKPVFEAWTKEFEKDNPDIEIVWEWNAYNSHFDRIKTDLLGQMAADIIFVNNWGWYPYRDVDMFVDLGKVPELEDVRASIMPMARDKFVYNNKMIGIPIGLVTRVPIVNNELFENAEVAIPYDRKTCFTYTEYVDLIKPVMNHKDNLNEIGLNITLTDLLISMLASVDAPMLDSDYNIKLNTPAGIKAVKEFQEFVANSGVVIPYDQSGGQGKYGSVTDTLLYKSADGKRLSVAGYSNPGNLLTPMDAGISVSAIPMIKASEGKDTLIGDLNTLVVPTFSKVKDKAYRVIKWLMSKEQQLKYLEFGDIPVNQEAYNEVFSNTEKYDPSIYSAYQVGMDNFFFMPSTSSKWQNFTSSYFKQLCKGQITPEKFCEEIATKGPQYYDDDK